MMCVYVCIYEYMHINANAHFPCHNNYFRMATLRLPGFRQQLEVGASLVLRPATTKELLHGRGQHGSLHNARAGIDTPPNLPQELSMA